MKKVVFYSILCLTLAVCAAWISPKNETSSNDLASAIDNKHLAYVDLGLPSGTKWKATNEPGMFDYEAATTRFEGKLPTAIQFYELCNKCKWTWLGNGYRVTGPNGNSIVLPTTGKHDCEGNMQNFNLEGYYWSVTPNGDGADRLFMSQGHVGISKESKCSTLCVRLVKQGK